MIEQARVHERYFSNSALLFSNALNPDFDLQIRVELYRLLSPDPAHQRLMPTIM